MFINFVKVSNAERYAHTPTSRYVASIASRSDGSVSQECGKTDSEDYRHCDIQTCVFLNRDYAIAIEVSTASNSQ